MNLLVDFFKHQDEALAKQGRTKQQRMIIYGGIMLGAVALVFGLLYLLNVFMQSVLNNATFSS